MTSLATITLFGPHVPKLLKRVFSNLCEEKEHKPCAMHNVIKRKF